MGNTSPTSPDLCTGLSTLILLQKPDLRYLRIRPTDLAQTLHAHSPYRRLLALQVSSRLASISPSYCSFCVDLLSVITATSRDFAYCGRTADPFDFSFGTLVHPIEAPIPAQFRVDLISRSHAIAIFVLSLYFPQPFSTVFFAHFRLLPPFH